ncbi:acyltransferase [Flavobacterium chungnamense]|uniref:Acyltransferase n=1 Tax=Flavobacterium chungnamense TaxID=706182 RepID=A0ABP7UBS9_9FLAO
MFLSIKNKIFKYLFIRIENIQKENEFTNKQALLRSFKKVGANSSFGKDNIIKNPQYIEIGADFSALDRFRIEAWDGYFGQKFEPKITIGTNVNFNTDIHIGCVNSITIGDNCLFGSRIYITDHNHGDTSDGMISKTPLERPLISKGPVVIENNVWVGEGVVIMPGVTIGANSIIGANSVVTKDVPKNTVVAGVPAKILKQLV